MQLVKHGRREADPYARLEHDAPVPDGVDVTVSLSRWLEQAHLLQDRRGRLGVALEADADIDVLGPRLSGIDLVVLEFPAFVDGRHYSNAVRLRTFYGFAGEIRATGDVGRDQLNYLNRCGFNAFELADDVDVEDFLRGLNDFSGVYQYAVDNRTPACRLRGAFM